METLHLRFAINLRDYGVDDFQRPNGPLFHRWLPNGRADALSIATADSRNRLTVWFERRGYIDASFIRYDTQRTEVDEEIMRRQARLDAGPIRGEAQFVHVSNAELQAILEDRVGSSEYIELGRRIIEFLYPPLSTLIGVLRIQYGQHWLPELRSWDSRSQSLGSYCSSTFYLHWRDGEDSDWRKFQPTDLSQTIRAERLPGRGYAEYLTQDDWRRIQTSFSPKAQIPLALRVVGRAHQLRDSDHISEAFVQAVTGLELAIEHFLNARATGLSKDTSELAHQLTGLPLKVQLSILAIATSLVPKATLDLALGAIDLRNKIVHEGATNDDPDRKMFLAIIECVKGLLDLGELKTPSLGNGNQLSPPEYGGRQAIVIGRETP
jgi:hypothetical protein